MSYYERSAYPYPSGRAASTYRYPPGEYACQPSAGYAEYPGGQAVYPGGYDEGYYVPSYGYNAPPAQPSGGRAWFDFSNGVYMRGLLIGAAVAVVVANPTLQRAIVRGAVKVWTGLQGGVEELKEQVQDIKAEMSRK